MGGYGPARPVDLQPDSAAAYRELERKLTPALQLWTRAATLLPGACCRDHLRGTGEADKLRALLRAVSEQCYRAIFHSFKLT